MKNSERRKKNEAYLEFAQAYLERTQIQSTVNLAETESTPEDAQMAVQNTGGYNVKTELLVENDHVLVGCSSVIGRRQSQQDSVTIPCDTQLLLEEHPKFICVLSDGMGGLRGGEQASACATQTLFDDYYRIMWRHCTHSYLDFFRAEAEKINTLVRGQEMIDVLQETAEDMNLAAFKLTAAATDKNFRGQDNTSVILIKIK